MKKKGIVTLSLVVALAAGVIGCASKTDSSKTSASGKGTEKITLKIMSAVQTESPGGPIEKEIADAYMKLHPNVEIQFIGVPMNDMYKKITALATGGDMPDAFTSTPEFMYNANGLNPVASVDFRRFVCVPRDGL